jgi:macrolide transport system ATP-binding/permease protein
MRTFLARFLTLFRKESLDTDLDCELGSHLQLLTEENIRKGLSPEEARYSARREFGGLQHTKELYREQRGLPFLETLLQDVRFGLRLIVKNGALSTIIIAIVAAAIGAGTSLYSLIDACLIRTTITRAVADRWEIVRAYLPHQKTYVNFMSAPEIS